MTPYIVGDLVRKNLDADVMPAAWLELAKAQMRVKFTDDDPLIRAYIAQAIEWLEVNADLCVNPQNWEWSFGHVNMAQRACACDWWYGGAPMHLPKRPVSSFTIKDGTDADVSAYWQTIRQQDATGIVDTLLQRVDVSVTTWPVTVAMTCGFPTPQDVPSLIQNAVLRYTAYLYENREAIQGAAFYAAPDFARTILGPLWVPRV